MTDDRKPETPGMSEVSPKFVDEAEAAVEAAAAQKAHDTIEAVLNKVPSQGEDETQIESVYRKVLALRENHPPRGCTDQDMAAWVDKHDGIEEAIGTLRAENLHDVEIKLAVLSDRLREDLDPRERPASGDFVIAQSARDDLGKLVSAASAKDEALSALWPEWQRLCEANDKAVMDADKAKLAKEAIMDHETPDYRAAAAKFEAAQKRPDETFAALMAVEDRIEHMAARSVKGAAIKLRVAKYWIDVDYPNGSSAGAKMPREERLSLSVLADLERMAEKHVEPVHTKAQELAGTEREHITALWGAYKETGAVLVARDGEHQESGTADADAVVTEAMEADKAAWGALVNERCHTLGGLLVKMSAFKSAVAESDFEGPPEVLFDAIVCDLERMTGEGVITRLAASDVVSPQRSPLFSRVFDMETPITDAEGAVEALWLLVEDGKLCPDAAEPIAYLVTHLNGHIQEQRRLFNELFVAAGGSAG